MPPTSRNKKNGAIGQANAGFVILLLVVFLAVLSFTLVIGFQSIVSVNEGHVVLSQLISQVEQKPFGLFFPDYDYDYYEDTNSNNDNSEDHTQLLRAATSTLEDNKLPGSESLELEDTTTSELVDSTSNVQDIDPPVAPHNETVPPAEPEHAQMRGSIESEIQSVVQGKPHLAEAIAKLEGKSDTQHASIDDQEDSTVRSLPQFERDGRNRTNLLMIIADDMQCKLWHDYVLAL